MKRVLYFFPLNPAEKNSGSSSRAMGLLRYFKDRNFKVDFISKQDWGKWTPDSVKKFNDADIADRLFVFRRKPVKKNPFRYFFTYKAGHILYQHSLPTIKGSIPNHSTLHLQRQFNDLLKQTTYDFIIISYAYWADLIRMNPLIGNSVTIMDTHDLLVLQHQHDKGYIRENAGKDEIRRLGLFDQVWAISPEEENYFKQFLGDKVKYVPPAMEEIPSEQTGSYKQHDIIYVATDNPHNLTAAAWFFEKVYPLLKTGLSICVIGSITTHVPKDMEGLTLIPFADDLNSFYNKSKIAICPMLSGTGVKIKVLEALSRGLPVVCNEQGMDGLPEKINNGCLVSNEPAAFASLIAGLLNDPALYEKQSSMARGFFIKYFSKTMVYKKMDSLFGLHP